MLKDNLIKIYKNFLKTGDLESAIFILEKICIISNYEQQDLYNYILALIRCERYNTVIKIIENQNINYLWCKIYLAQCYSSLENTNEALKLLNFLQLKHKDYSNIIKLKKIIDTESSFINSFLLLSDAVYHLACLKEYSGNIESTLYYTISLILNPFKFKVARKLFEDGLLQYNEIYGIIQEIEQFYNQWKQIDHQSFVFIIQFYQSFINKDTDIFDGEFKNSWDIRRWKAQRYLQLKSSSQAYEILSSVMKESGNQEYLSCIVYSISLFQHLNTSAFKLFSAEFPKDNIFNHSSLSISLFIQSLQYISETKSNDALATIKKAVKSNWCAMVRLQPYCMSPSLLWMAQGHTSWNCGDLENSLASFIASCDSTPGHPWSWFCAGVTHMKSSHYDLALPYLTNAYNISSKFYSIVPNLIMNEIACCFYYKKEYNHSISILKKIITSSSISQMNSSELTEYLPIYYLNLAHSYLKLRHYNTALDIAQSGLPYNTSCTSLIRIIAYLNDLLGNHETAQLMYHRSMFLSPQISECLPKNMTKLFDYAIIPPEANIKLYRQQDIFCFEMLKHSTYASNLKIIQKQSN